MGCGNDGRGDEEWGNAKAQGRNEKQVGMTEGGWIRRPTRVYEDTSHAIATRKLRSKLCCPLRRSVLPLAS